MYHGPGSDSGQIGIGFLLNFIIKLIEIWSGAPWPQICIGFHLNSIIKLIQNWSGAPWPDLYQFYNEI